MQASARRKRAAQAARLLRLAQETADRLTAEAKAGVGQGAGRREESGRGDGHATPPPARRRPSGTAGSRPRAWTREAKARYDEVLGKLATERVGLEKKIEELRTYEREYRGRLKSWISDQLAQLDGDASREQAAAVVADPALSRSGAAGPARGRGTKRVRRRR